MSLYRLIVQFTKSHFNIICVYIKLGDKHSIFSRLRRSRTSPGSIHRLRNQAHRGKSKSIQYASCPLGRITRYLYRFQDAAYSQSQRNDIPRSRGPFSVHTVCLGRSLDRRLRPRHYDPWDGTRLGPPLESV